MASSTALIARRSIRARLGRLIAIAVAIVVGVSFVVGSFVLADSLRAGFDSLFEQVSQNVDFEVRSSVAFDDTGQGGQIQRDPIPQEVADQVAAVDGVAATEPLIQRYAQFVDADGDAVSTGGAPTFGAAWTGDASLSGIEIKGDGQPPSGPDQVAIDKATADREDFEVGDQVTVLTDTGSHQFTITALVGVGDSDGFYGATMAVWDVPTAQSVLGAEGVYDALDVGVADGADAATVRQRIEDVLPDGTEIVDRATLIDEANDQVNSFIGPFGTGLLIFAFITAFVSAFLINNVFAITIGQRLRELALLRAVGASGRQVRRMIFLEALIMSVIATVVGIGGGMLVAKGILAVFNATGAGFPDTALKLLPRTVIWAFVVGVGVTMAAVIIPALRAARDPAGGGDAAGARLRRAERPPARRWHDRHGPRRGHVPARDLRPPRRHARDRRPRRRRRHPHLPRRRQPLLDRRPPGDPDDRLAGGQGLRDAGQARPRERRAGAAAHIGDGVGADDRRRPRQRRGRVRGVAAGHVRRRPRARRHRRPARAAGQPGRRPGPAAGRRRHDRGAARGRRQHPDPGRAGPGRGRAQVPRRRRPDRPARADQHRHHRGWLRRPRRRRHPRAQGPGQGPRPRSSATPSR